MPFAGKKSVRKRLSEIENEAGSLAVIFGTLFTKIFESIVTGDLILASKFAAGAFFVGVVYVYRKETTEKVKETAEEITDN